ncbi:ABC transporter permease [Sphingomonas sp. 3-13AW]|jgi:ABC-2 type transport system permease protein|uniref:ABC transporter permease n=1 Tax=Sphingomonas sp. 3-13AW TaxID=3050450 RepID=UPI003BB4B601
MADQPPAPENRMSDPGVPVIRNVNWGGLRALYIKEVRRFFKVQLQTIWAPAIQTLLYLVVFTTALGARGAVPVGDGTVAFADFLAPGLIVMGMLTNAYANASFSLLVGKMQGTIVDYLMPPLSTGELLAALTAGAVTRAFLVGGAVWLAMAFWPGVHVTPQHLWAILWFGLLGSIFLALIGVLTSIWAEKFDHAAAVQNFVVGPLTLLSGTFYSVDRLSPTFQAISHANPFFYIISGFRYGFIGTADSPVLVGSLFILAADVVLAVIAYRLLAIGWKTKS